MSKIICDVCGTSYADTATHCPICGCVRAGDVGVISGDTNEKETNSGSYTYVKGGRFSKSNVKKRSAAVTPGDEPAKKAPSAKNGKGKETGLIIVVILLLLAIVAVVVFIAMRFFAPVLPTNDNTGTTGTSATAPSDTTPTETTELKVPCTNVTVSKAEITFEKVDAALLLNVKAEPADTTDEIVFASTDENVAVVSEDGKVTAVGPGQASITITCGQAVAECRVVCDFEIESTEESTEPSTDATEPNNDEKEPATTEVWDMNWHQYSEINGEKMGDVSLARGEKWTVYLDREGKVKSTAITFATSDASVVTVDNTGVATAVGSGTAVISAEYKGQKVKCYVRVG